MGILKLAMFENPRAFRLHRSTCSKVPNLQLAKLSTLELSKFSALKAQDQAFVCIMLLQL